jgi:hypothetical protein
MANLNLLAERHHANDCSKTLQADFAKLDCDQNGFISKTEIAADIKDSNVSAADKTALRFLDEHFNFVTSLRDDRVDHTPIPASWGASKDDLHDLEIISDADSHAMQHAASKRAFKATALAGPGIGFAVSTLGTVGLAAVTDGALFGVFATAPLWAPVAVGTAVFGTAASAIIYETERRSDFNKLNKEQKELDSFVS